MLYTPPVPEISVPVGEMVFDSVTVADGPALNSVPSMLPTTAVLEKLTSSPTCPATLVV